MRYINVRALVQLCLSLLLLSVSGLSAAETIELVREHGVFKVPVRINDAVTIPFVLNSGASDVSVPEDVFKTLVRTGTVTKSDFLPPGTYINADGLALSKQRFMLHQLRLGDHVVKDVVASVASDKADPLLGQSFLKMLPTWTLDNTRDALVFGNASSPSRSCRDPAPAGDRNCFDEFDAGAITHIRIIDGVAGCSRRDDLSNGGKGPTCRTVSPQEELVVVKQGADFVPVRSRNKPNLPTVYVLWNTLAGGPPLASLNTGR